MTIYAEFTLRHADYKKEFRKFSYAVPLGEGAKYTHEHLESARKVVHVAFQLTTDRARLSKSQVERCREAMKTSVDWFTRIFIALHEKKKVKPEDILDYAIMKICLERFI